MAGRILLGLLAVSCMAAQAVDPRRFDVASVKPCKAEGGRSGSRDAASPGRLREDCVTVMNLIRQAYVEYAGGHQSFLSSVPIEGGPAWIDSDFYEIDAAAEGAPGFAVMRGPMLQTLLEERFKLKIHRETREIPVYALTVAKDGAKLQAAQPGKCIARDPDHPVPASQRPPGLWFCGVFTPTTDGSYMYGTTLANFCGALSIVLDRTVVDRTGIAGVFDIHIPTDSASGGAVDGAPRPAGAVVPASPTDALGSAIFAAVQRVGLKLEPAKGSGEFLIIDHVEKPSEN